MQEMPVTGEDHRGAAFVGGLDDFLITDRSTGLDGGRGPRFERGDEAVGKGEHGVAGDDGTV